MSEVRDEHQQAIEWLNQHTDEKSAFFLIEIELWRIDNSPLAPKFNIVEKLTVKIEVQRQGLPVPFSKRSGEYGTGRRNDTGWYKESQAIQKTKGGVATPEWIN